MFGLAWRRRILAWGGGLRRTMWWPPPVSSKDRLTLHEQFELARTAAIELTDRYYHLAQDDSERRAVWAQAMHQTEVARQLLEAWLRAENSVMEPERTPSLVLA